jgi:hypothetical protein
MEDYISPAHGMTAVSDFRLFSPGKKLLLKRLKYEAMGHRLSVTKSSRLKPVNQYTVFH